ncbi:YpmS family protein [Lentibacillus sp. Marseille-P4043]|uniref:YpmS family protein n=1 Tax=Lentibacillus sp. Marseille-P4043 TaxID=2040293 RepID=UPI000D0AE49C|nr:YpmS family protein [Lentibacillus sp. Marseille-P4043]
MTEHKTNKPQKNKWKRLFYSLLTINVVIIGLLALFIFWPVSETAVPDSKTQATQESSEFVVRTTKENLNELVNAYIDKLLNDSAHNYKISLEDDVHLIGELPAFSTTVPLSVHLEPIVQDNGNVILKQNSISIGLLELPNQTIMKYMKKYLPMPEWVTVNPKDEEIYVAVNEMDIKSNFHVSIERFDLGANDLAFKIKVPYETLGIELGKFY